MASKLFPHQTLDEAAPDCAANVFFGYHDTKSRCQRCARRCEKQKGAATHLILRAVKHSPVVVRLRQPGSMSKGGHGPQRRFVRGP
jgi:hypothetical protein